MWAYELPMPRDRFDFPSKAGHAKRMMQMPRVEYLY